VNFGFALAGVTVMLAFFVAHMMHTRPKGQFVSKKSLRRHLDKVEEDERRTTKDRMVYEAARDLVDRLATDRTCQHNDDWWLGDRCRQCAIVLVKDAIYKVLSREK
jgi:hypothetical protein